ncbi:MAG: 50S ribosomal protein L18 [Rhodothermia bacterium]
MSKNYKRLRRERIRRGMRGRIRGTAARPRLSVFRSHAAIYVQAVDDTTGRTLASSSSRKGDIGDVKGSPTEVSKAAGSVLAERLKSAGIETAVFDRNTYRFHGRVKALADAVRKGGIKF